jgi:hypothetical protein
VHDRSGLFWALAFSIRSPLEHTQFFDDDKDYNYHGLVEHTVLLMDIGRTEIYLKRELKLLHILLDTTQSEQERPLMGDLYV